MKGKNVFKIPSNPIYLLFLRPFFLLEKGNLAGSAGLLPAITLPPTPPPFTLDRNFVLVIRSRVKRPSFSSYSCCILCRSFSFPCFAWSLLPDIPYQIMIIWFYLKKIRLPKTAFLLPTIWAHSSKMHKKATLWVIVGETSGLYLLCHSWTNHFA